MKNMKNLKLIFISLLSTAFFASCNNNSNSNSTTNSDSVSTSMSSDTSMNNDTSNVMSNSTGTAYIDDEARDFVKKAATGGMMEVELGKLAESKGKSQSVKDFGKMMVDDHSKANEELKSIASIKKMDVPSSLTDDQRKDVDKLSKKEGADFDKAYVDMMVEDHRKDVDAFKKAAGNLTDNDLKTFATNTIPTLQKHLDAILNVKSKM